MAELVFFSGTMDCGKSTLALQMDHNHSARGRSGLIFTKHDRAGENVLSSRLGLETKAEEVHEDLDFWDVIVRQAASGVVEYEVLCRRHYMRRMTSHAARAVAPTEDVLPFDLEVCPVPQQTQQMLPLS